MKWPTPKDVAEVLAYQVGFISLSIGKERMLELRHISADLGEMLGNDGRVNNALEAIAVICMLHSVMMDRSLVSYMEKAHREMTGSIIEYKETKQ